MPATLAYWNIHGLAEPIRMLLEYTGEPYEDKRYAFGATPETMRKEWLDEKFKLGLDFPNLPYFIDGDVRMTQSAAIMRYIARKHDLLGATEKDRIRTDVCEQQCVDFRNGFGRLIMGGNQEKDRADYVKALPDKLRELDAFLGDKFEWFGGSKITFVDFLMYSMLRVHVTFESHCLDSFEHLKSFLKRFEAQPRVADYIKSDRHKKTPFFPPMAPWGNTPLLDH